MKLTNHLTTGWHLVNLMVHLEGSEGESRRNFYIITLTSLKSPSIHTFSLWKQRAQQPTSSGSMENVRGEKVSRRSVGRWVRHNISGVKSLGSTWKNQMVCQRRRQWDLVLTWWEDSSCFRGKGHWEGVRRQAMGVLLWVWALSKTVMWWHKGCKSALSQEGSFPYPAARCNLPGGALSQGGNVCVNVYDRHWNGVLLCLVK